MAIQKASLISDLQTLEARTKRLDTPLARAAAEAEVGEAAWAHDREWAKELLREAYQLTLPSEEQRARMRKIPVGAHPRLPSSSDRTRWALGRRILQVAARDSAFAAELAKSRIDQLGVYEGQMVYASLGQEALTQGDIDAANRYLSQSIDADPTQISTLNVIQELGERDRVAADAIILRYLERLNATPLAFVNGSVERVYYSLGQLILIPYESSTIGTATKPSLPGPAVMRAYCSYMLYSFGRLQLESPPGASSGWLRMIWPLLSKYAPELTPQFLDLEQRSRKPGDTFSLPTAKSMEKKAREDYERRMEVELAADQPDEHMIRSAIGRGNFGKARKMIDKLADGALKTELIEYTNAQEAVSLANKGDIFGARSLAEKLAKTTYILQAYPVIAAQCVTKKDDLCAKDTVVQAVKQLRKADTSAPIPPAGIPASIFAGPREYDRTLASLSKLALSVISIKDGLALDVLDELVIVANHSEVDTSQGLTGFESSLFKKLAERDEGRATLAALQLEDHLRQIVALAAIDQWKSERLVAEAKLQKKENESSVKKN